MLLVIDNYDSFTYNLVQYLGELGAELHVMRNDKVDWQKVQRLAPTGIVISPGPGTPDDAGVSCQIVSDLSKTIPTLGVCLGHQCIGQVFGGTVRRAAHVMHGKTSEISHTNKGVFRGLPNPFTATRYHSLIVDRLTIPEEVEITAWCDEGQTVMGVQHREYPIHGVQFHPESILTGEGKQLLKNFLRIAGQ